MGKDDGVMEESKRLTRHFLTSIFSWTQTGPIFLMDNVPEISTIIISIRRTVYSNDLVKFTPRKKLRIDDDHTILHR